MSRRLNEPNSGIFIILLLIVFVFVFVRGCDDTPPVVGKATLIVIQDPEKMTLAEHDQTAKIRELETAWYKQDKNAPACLLLEKGMLAPDGNLHPGVAYYAARVPDGNAAYAFIVIEPDGREPVVTFEGPVTDAEAIIERLKPPTGLTAAWKQQQYARAAAPLFSDVDFRRDPKFLGGYLEPTSNLVATKSVPNFRDVFKTIPRSEWDKWLEKFPPQRMYAQVRGFYEQTMGSCVGDSGINSHEWRSGWHFGERYWTPESPLSLYNRIGSSPGSGAYIPDGVEEMTERGALPLDTPESKVVWTHTHPENQWGGMPTGWETTGRNFRGQYVRITDIESWFTSLMKYRRPIWYGRSGHAICSLWAERGKFAYENSWGKDWGSPPSIGYDSESLIRGMTGYALMTCTVREDVHVPYPKPKKPMISHSSKVEALPQLEIVDRSRPPIRAEIPLPLPPVLVPERPRYFTVCRWVCEHGRYVQKKYTVTQSQMQIGDQILLVRPLNWHPPWVCDPDWQSKPKPKPKLQQTRRRQLRRFW